MRIASEYATASAGRFAGHPLATFIRGDAARALQGALGPFWEDMRASGSPGISQWSDSPWLAVLDPLVTDSPTRGYYVAYLFPRSLHTVSLSLQIGTTEARRRLGSGREVRLELASLISRIRSALAGEFTSFPDAEIALKPLNGSTRAAFYERAHAFGKTYSIGALPDEAELTVDLREMVRLYRMLTVRAGDELSMRTIPAEQSVLLAQEDLSGWEDPSRSRLHRRVERNRYLANAAKQALGYRCEACLLKFDEIYGEIGAGYIQAHHRVPISILKTQGRLRLRPEKDFAVLCANCHAMIHRRGAPGTVDELRALIEANRRRFGSGR